MCSQASRVYNFPMAKGVLFYNGRFAWNVTSHVGPGCPNKPDDVQLVQLGYYCRARNPKAGTTPEEKATAMAVVPGAPYTGAASDPLTIAIKAHQKARGGTQDGKVSPIPGNQPAYSADMSWMIIPLSNNIYDVLRDVWPAIHKSQQCPPALAATSKAVFEP
jgi:hypothetical protein